MKKKILVTGGTGYIGSHTVVELQNEGFEVLIIDNLSNSREDVLDGITRISGIRPQFFCFDLCNYSDLARFFAQHSDISAVIHFAASKAVGESVTDSLKYYRNNLFSLVNLLEMMKQYNVANFVFSSSCTVYGQPDQLPVTEQAPIKPANSPYGNTKQIAEEIINDAIVSYGNLQAIALRYFNPIGAHPTAHIGELPNGVPSNLIPFITQTAIGKRSLLRVFGSDYNTPDGSCVRDFINVVDLARAHVIAIKRLLDARNKTPFEMFNLGTGTGVSVLELINTFQDATGVKVPYEIVDRRPGDVEKVWANNSLATNELGWTAKETLVNTLRSAWAWELRIKERGL